MSFYLEKYSVRDQLIDSSPSKELKMIVVIPCSNEPDLISSLQAISDCQRTLCDVEVIVVVNSSEDATNEVVARNQETLKEGKVWVEDHQDPKLSYHFIEEHQLPKKHAGVGLARKIGMDEAVRRLESVGNSNGLIVCFDADAMCQTNYLIEIEKHFANHSKSPACSIHFEHPIEGEEFSDEIYDGITQYELHLRYYKNGLAYAGLPYAFHTIGSSMAVRCDAYQKQNGMNKRKAGEDFYFLQKLIPLGNYTEIKSTNTIPSPRVSDRVPFGTGKAMQNWLDEGKKELLSYPINSFQDMKSFTSIVPDLFEGDPSIPESVSRYLETIDFKENLTKVRSNSSSREQFEAIFYKWFNAFKVLKFMHFSRDNYYEDVPIFESANDLLEIMGEGKEKSNKELLVKYRSIDLN